MLEEQVVNPVALLQQHYRHMSSVSEKHLLQLVSEGAISTFTLQKGETKSFQGGSNEDSFYLLTGELNYTVNDADQVVMNIEDAEIKPVLINDGDTLIFHAQQDCMICRVDSNQIDFMISWDTLVDATSTASYDISVRLAELNNPAIFMQLPFEYVERLFDKMARQDVSAGDIIIEQGDAAEKFYIIDKGRAEVLQQGIYDDEQKKVAELGVGDHFGEDALIANVPRNATVRMLEDGSLWELQNSDFQFLIHSELVNQVVAEDAQELSEGGAVFIDVRYEEEYYNLHLKDALQISLPDLRKSLDLLDRQTKYITYCDSSRRSSVAAMILKQDGFNAEYLKGGINQWPYDVIDVMGG